MDAMEIYGDIVNVCADSETCPHGALPHVAEVPNMRDLTEHLVQIIVDAGATFVAGGDDGTQLVNTMSHALIIMAGIGYAVGAEHAYDIVLTSDIDVPDSLAALDFVEPLDGGRGGE